MQRPSILSEPTTPFKRKLIERRNTINTTKNISHGFNFDREAIQVFNQVTANKNRILTKNSDGFYTKTTVRTKKFDSSGSEVIEKFEATSYGGVTEDGERLGEVVQKYFNEKTGAEKASVQRIMGNKLKRIEVKRTFEVESTNEYEENFDSEFEKQWRIGAKALGVRKIVPFEKKISGLSPSKAKLE